MKSYVTSRKINFQIVKDYSNWWPLIKAKDTLGASYVGWRHLRRVMSPDKTGKGSRSRTTLSDVTTDMSQMMSPNTSGEVA